MSDIAGPMPGTILGEAAKPPFAVLPDPSWLFLNRARRFATLAPTHELGTYLAFLAVLTGAQHEIQADLPALEPLADDVATLDLDTLLAEEGWRRGGQNPFLLGY